LLRSSVTAATRTIVSARLDWLRLPLRVPYDLSFASIREFDIFISEYAFDDGTQGYGETAPLPGYTAETPDDVWSNARAIADRLVGADFNRIAADLQRARVPSFAATLMTMPFAWLELAAGGPVRYPLLGTVMSHALETVESDVHRLFASGYSTLKVKVGWNVERDIAYVRAIERAIDSAQAAGFAPERPLYRIDANQAYDLEEARRFIESLDPARIELFEQPFDPENWEAMAALGRVAVPLMLDESIHDDESIDRAASLGNVDYVKFKLMKMGGVAPLRRAIVRAQELGLGVVLGNGVAADINCIAEAAIARDLGLQTAGEMNGFLKPVAAIASAVGYEAGDLVGDPANVVADRDVRTRYAVGSVEVR